MLGLEKGMVRLAAYTPEWARLFEKEKHCLQAKVGAYILDIQHIGSTSIPGMLAKPILDIAIGVEDFEEAKRLVPWIEELGYEYRGEFGMPLRHYFVKGEPHLFHLHVLEITSPNWTGLLLFRDYLRWHPDVALEYAELKVQLASQYPMDRGAYLDGKAGFIERVIQLARGQG